MILINSTQRNTALNHIAPLIPVDFHEFPWHPCNHDEDGTVKGHLKNPEQGDQVRFHTGTRFHRTKDPARERADIPPGGARSWTTQKWDEGGGSGGGSNPVRRFR